MRTQEKKRESREGRGMPNDEMMRGEKERGSKGREKERREYQKECEKERKSEKERSFEPHLSLTLLFLPRTIFHSPPLSSSSSHPFHPFLSLSFPHFFSLAQFSRFQQDLFFLLYCSLPLPISYTALSLSLSPFLVNCSYSLFLLSAPLIFPFLHLSFSLFLSLSNTFLSPYFSMLSISALSPFLPYTILLSLFLLSAPLIFPSFLSLSISLSLLVPLSSLSHPPPLTERERGESRRARPKGGKEDTPQSSSHLIPHPWDTKKQTNKKKKQKKKKQEGKNKAFTKKKKKTKNTNKENKVLPKINEKENNKNKFIRNKKR